MFALVESHVLKKMKKKIIKIILKIKLMSFRHEQLNVLEILWTVV